MLARKKENSQRRYHNYLQMLKDYNIEEVFNCVFMAFRAVGDPKGLRSLFLLCGALGFEMSGER